MPRRVYDEQYDNDKELKKGHTSISLKKRLKLIELVFEQKLTIYRAAKRLKICHPTAKFIIKSYKKGRIYEYEGDSLPILQDSPLKPTLSTPPPSPPTPLQSDQPMPPPVCLAGVWTAFNNQLFLMPVYYYQ